MGWGSTSGVIKTAVTECLNRGIKVGHAHIRYLNPLPKNLGEIIKKFDRVIVPEMNNGQLVKIIRDKYLVDAKGINKIKGIPFSTQEIIQAIEESIVKA